MSAGKVLSGGKVAGNSISTWHNRSPKPHINRDIGEKIGYLANLLSKLLSSGREK